VGPAPFNPVEQFVPKETPKMNDETITIRRASSGDRAVLDHLAARDSAVLPDDDFLIAQVGDEVWAAIGLCTHTLMADPFRPSAPVADLLRLRAEEANGQVIPAEPRPSLLQRLRWAHTPAA
jgi:hypothetical protein